MKKVAIVQSNYIPWKGYFDIIAAVDEFILFDDAQFTKNDWRNRNLIKTPKGTEWLTVPIRHKYRQKICDTKISSTKWSFDHWKSLQQNYKRASHFDEIAELIKPLYLEKKYTYLSELNRDFILLICHYLGIKTNITTSSDYHLFDGKTERLIELCRQVGGTEYISGPAAKSYINENSFHKSNIKLTWFDYDNYPEYPQIWSQFTHKVTVLDLLFNCGKNTEHFMKCMNTK